MGLVGTSSQISSKSKKKYDKIVKNQIFPKHQFIVGIGTCGWNHWKGH